MILSEPARLRGRGPCVVVLSGGPAAAPTGRVEVAEPGPPPVTIAPTLAALVEALSDLMEEDGA